MVVKKNLGKKISITSPYSRNTHPQFTCGLMVNKVGGESFSGSNSHKYKKIKVISSPVCPSLDGQSYVLLVGGVRYPMELV